MRSVNDGKEVGVVGKELWTEGAMYIKGGAGRGAKTQPEDSVLEWGCGSG